MAVASYLTLALRSPTVWSTIGHGSRVSVRERAMLKRKGLRAGMPDIVVFHPFGGRTLVVAPELKAKAGRASAEQVTTGAALRAANVDWQICKSVDDVAALLAAAGVPLFARPMGLGVYGKQDG